MSALRRLAVVAGRALADLVGPSTCASCNARVGPQTLFCPPCAASVERSSGGPRDELESHDRGGAAFEYGGAMATAILRLKYEERPDLGPRLGLAMVTVADHARGAVDLVVPVPLHPKRLAERGYNQSVLLAAPIARALEVPLAPRLLRRRSDTPRQAALDRPTRLVNVRDAFVARAPTQGRRVLLIDDVRTTGATLRACAAVLRGAGASRVLTLALARRSRDDSPRRPPGDDPT